MRFEPRRAFAEARPLRHAAREALPPQLDFLRVFGIADGALWAAATRAAADGVSPMSALLASGTVSETCYYSCLARHLGRPFVADWPRLRPPLDVRLALVRGRVALADDPRALWLLAPEAPTIELMLAGRALGLAASDTALTTPTHLARFLCHRAGAPIAQLASRALPDARPRHSALGALSPLAAVVIGLMLGAILVGAACGSHEQAVVLGLVFLAGVAFRLLVCAAALAGEAAEPVASIADVKLPSYCVLVPLKDEAGMVAGLVRALAALDYPPAKREVLLLVEADDAATRVALAGPLPPGFRMIEVPPGLPRTKPRALNVGLLLTRAELVTVFDAEDRPDRDQLRRAATRFAAAPVTVACLQARLKIEHGATLLSRLFAMEYAVLFDLFDVGLSRWQMPLALGGTSNHFRGMGQQTPKVS